MGEHGAALRIEGGGGEVARAMAVLSLEQGGRWRSGRWDGSGAALAAWVRDALMANGRWHGELAGDGSSGGRWRRAVTHGLDGKDEGESAGEETASGWEKTDLMKRKSGIGVGFSKKGKKFKFNQNF